MNSPSSETGAAPGTHAETLASKQHRRGLGTRRLLLSACGLSLFALALMAWSVLDPTPLPVMVVMSIGQVLGTLGLLCYLAAVIVYAWRRKEDHPRSP